MHLPAVEWIEGRRGRGSGYECRTRKKVGALGRVWQRTETAAITQVLFAQEQQVSPNLAGYNFDVSRLILPSGCQAPQSQI